MQETMTATGLVPTLCGKQDQWPGLQELVQVAEPPLLPVTGRRALGGAEVGVRAVGGVAGVKGI